MDNGTSGYEGYFGGRRRGVGLYVRAVLFVLGLVSPLHAATYYVNQTGGTNSYTCAQAQSLATPKATINAGLGCLANGDTLIIKAGTYAESISAGAIRSGISDTQRTTIQSVIGETVILRPTTGSAQGDVVSIYDSSYITLDGLIIDGTNVANVGLRIGTNSDTSPHSHFITFQNGVVRNVPHNSCIDVHGAGGQNSNLRFSNLEIFNCGSGVTNQFHGIYLKSRDSIVETCKIHDVVGYGIHHFASGVSVNNNVIRYNEVYNSRGIIVASGSNTVVHNNIVRDNLNGGGGGLVIYDGASNIKAYQNTLFNNDVRCIWVRSGAGHVIRNNICNTHTLNSIIVDPSASMTASNNLCSNPLPTCSVSGDPLFVAPASKNFALQANSPAINNGVVITGGPGQSCVGCFHGTNPDIGAFETLFVASANAPNTTTDKSVVLNVTANIVDFRPVYPASGCTGFTVTKNGVNNPVTACTRSATSQMTLTVQNAFLAGDTIRLSYVPGSVTDGADIGRGVGVGGTGRRQQLNAITHLAVTNNVQ